MTKPLILVTGATGKTGSAVVSQLREAGWPVRALVRAADHRSERLENLGAEIVRAELTDYEAMRAAMRGTARAYFCPPFAPHMLQTAVTFALAAREERLESVVGLSQWLASPSHPSLLTRQHWLADRLFALLPDTALTIVNPGFFADLPYLAVLKYAALLGVYPMPAGGQSKNAPPSVDDIARVSVAALIDPPAHAGKTYRPTGPALLSLDEMVAIVRDVLGRRVRRVRIPFWMFYKAARVNGYDPYSLVWMRDYFAELDAGTFAYNAPSGDVLAVTGHEAEPFAATVQRYAALPQMRATLANVTGAFAEFSSIAFRPGLDPARYARQLALPPAPAPLYDLDNPRWRLEHGGRSDESAMHAWPVVAGVR